MGYDSWRSKKMNATATSRYQLSLKALTQLGHELYPILAFLVADTRLYTLPCRSVDPSVVRHIFEFRAVFALLLLPNRPRLDCRVSGLV